MCSRMGIYLYERVAHILFPSKGHKTILTCLSLCAWKHSREKGRVRERQTDRQIDRDGEGESFGIHNSTCSLTLCSRSQTGSRERKAYQEHWEVGMSALMYTSTSSLHLVCVCVCIWVHRRKCVSVCRVHLPAFGCMCTVSVCCCVSVSVGAHIHSVGRVSRGRCYRCQPSLISPPEVKGQKVQACIPPEVRIISGSWTQPTAMRKNKIKGGLYFTF